MSRSYRNVQKFATKQIPKRSSRCKKLHRRKYRHKNKQILRKHFLDPCGEYYYKKPKGYDWWVIDRYRLLTLNEYMDYYIECTRTYPYYTNHLLGDNSKSLGEEIIRAIDARWKIKNLCK